jgi:uncharacterized membrane protein YkvA (DUF1232 family)
MVNLCHNTLEHGGFFVEKFNEGQAVAGMKMFKGKAFEYLKDRKKAMGLLKEATKRTKSEQGRIESFKNQLLLLIDVFQDWISGNYRHISYKTISTVVIGILYFVVPTDVIPDFLLGAGLVDDAAILAFIFKQIGNDLDLYKEWKNNQDTIMTTSVPTIETEE